MNGNTNHECFVRETRYIKLQAGDCGLTFLACITEILTNGLF